MSWPIPPGLPVLFSALAALALTAPPLEQCSREVALSWTRPPNGAAIWQLDHEVPVTAESVALEGSPALVTVPCHHTVRGRLLIEGWWTPPLAIGPEDESVNVVTLPASTVSLQVEGREATLAFGGAQGMIQRRATTDMAGELTIQTKPWLDAPAEGLLALLGVAGTLERGETIAGTIENEGETGIRVVLEDRPRNDD